MNDTPIYRRPGLIFGILACLILSGCASGTRYSDYRSSIPPIPPGQGRIWFYRTTGMAGAAVRPNVNLDDVSIGNAVPRGFFYKDTTPGQHEIKCITEWANKTTVTVYPNTDTYVKLRLSIGVFIGHIIPTVVPPEEAVKEMRRLSFCKYNQQ